MSSIATVSEEADRAGAGSVGEAGASVRAAPEIADERRSVMVPVLVAVVVTLIGGVFGLAVAGFNTLRDDMGTLRSDLSSEIGTLRSDLSGEIGTLRSDLSGEIGTLRSDLSGEIGTVRSDLSGEISALRDDMNTRFAEFRASTDEGFRQVNAVLLDHTDRLARIETALDIVPAAAAQP